MGKILVNSTYPLPSNSALLALAAAVGERLIAAQNTLCVAESCTGGLIAATLTEIAGSSIWFERGFVTYSNLSKQQLLNVQEQTLEQFGAVSEETALAMVMGALQASAAQCAIAVTGIAGPGGGSLEKPVGTVFIAWAIPGLQLFCERNQFQGDRHSIRLQSTQRALHYLITKL